MANCPRPSLPRHPLGSTASAPKTARRNDGGGYFLAQHRGDIEVDRSTGWQEHQTKPGTTATTCESVPGTDGRAGYLVFWLSA